MKREGPTLYEFRPPLLFLPFVLFGVGVQVLLGPADSLLELPFDFLRLTLDLLASISGGTTHSAADSAFHLLGRTLELILHALLAQVSFLGHVFPPVGVM